MPSDKGRTFIRESLAFIDEVDGIARAMVARNAPGPVLTSELAVRIAELSGTDPPLTAQTVPTARAHLYALAREGLIEAAWLPRTGTQPGGRAAEENRA